MAVFSQGRFSAPVFFMLALYTTISVADDSSDEEFDPHRQMETIVVTATRTEESVLDVAEAVSVVGAEDIARQAPEILAEMLRGVPGAFFQQTTPGQGIPGWDCHGLPIELMVEKKVGKAGVKVDAKTFRQKCREYALKQVNGQREDFKRLGVLGDWDKPYLTMDHKFEANIVRSLGKILEKGSCPQRQQTCALVSGLRFGAGRSRS